MNLPNKKNRDRIRQMAIGEATEAQIAAERVKRDKEAKELEEMQARAKARYLRLVQKIPDVVIKAIADGKVEVDIIVPENPPNYTTEATAEDCEVARLVMEFFANEKDYRFQFKQVPADYNTSRETADGGCTDTERVHRMLPGIIIGWYNIADPAA